MTNTAAEMSGTPSENAGSNIAGMGSFFIDPQGAAKRLFTKWFWVWPLLVFMLVSLVGNFVVTPIVQNVLTSQPVPAGVNPETYQRQIEVGMKVQRIAGIVFPVLMIAFQALVLWGMASMVAVEAKYRQMLNLAAGCALIQALAAIAGVIILKAKGDISSMAELRPALGLDIFLPDSTNKVLLALVGYFSIFEIWWIVMMVLILCAAYRIGKAKAAAIVAPLVLISLVFRVVIAAFQRS